ncbi:MAG: hypothetical protein ABSG46_20505 [Candidatus Binataceae bacterium]|jgi:hypothetical protein
MTVQPYDIKSLYNKLGGIYVPSDTAYIATARMANEAGWQILTPEEDPEIDREDLAYQAENKEIIAVLMRLRQIESDQVPGFKRE